MSVSFPLIYVICWFSMLQLEIFFYSWDKVIPKPKSDGMEKNKNWTYIKMHKHCKIKADLISFPMIQQNVTFYSNCHYLLLNYLLSIKPSNNLLIILYSTYNFFFFTKLLQIIFSFCIINSHLTQSQLIL